LLPEIEDCPFCGGKGKIESIELPMASGTVHIQAEVECTVCGACGPVMDTMEKAVLYWNRRIRNEV
jgi:Lar family restriction alleviation protein